ncbi:hypothetical protein EDC90_101774 [Martelella mediterranea]|uniref:Uncharacterized protein n=1 Tax=Martelella mediterranea TaxID=293089 RepID=A0A4R3NQY8_9HYPH|nr:hypothetical protein EDC90_101774 [Martelella mediterranea]
MLAVSALTVSACSPADPQPVIRTVTTKVMVPDASRQSCLDLMSRLPAEGGLNEEDVTNLWGNDRLAIKTCDRRRDGAINSIDNANAAAEVANGGKID